MDWRFALELLVSAFLIFGGVFAVVGAMGMVRFKDFYMRLHGPTKSTTLGVGCILLASMSYYWLRTDTLSMQEMLITLFLFITTPVSAHLLTMSGLHHKLPCDDATRGRPYELKESGGATKESTASKR
ncbi:MULTISPECIES: Na+/H+ antiporter subunit G [Larsenimonas]|uniref:Na+/H+ antiporter subunit G n=1 Tax=Larsenimonas suaedae TaxID=1851019 RepID=A0ABU1GV00_9GAMM|nr:MULTISPECIES: Na+/H+ antiporter subunit G [Larsenimonas]MCM2971849.1 Na+/H+ antiporter subunit G [Larsenimonas suaedae]MCM5703927.1 Na+/H+ antiporter subunit G [Larsenimonas salina]MDR5895401.1 Na+/H+ antiporter subunit G [Larsenimonas suaedae]